MKEKSREKVKNERPLATQTAKVRLRSAEHGKREKGVGPDRRKKIEDGAEKEEKKGHEKQQPA